MMVNARDRDRTEDDAERVRMALTEAGHGNRATVDLESGEVWITWLSPVTDDSNFRYPSWKAMAVAGIAARCWPCMRRSFADLEPPGPCPHPIDPFCREDQTEPSY